MKKDPKFFLLHIIESIELIERYTRNMTAESFLNDTAVQDAVLRRLEIIGEASNNVDQDFKLQYPAVAWREAASLRNFLIHEYFGVSFQEVWNVLQNDLPMLKKHMQEILEKLK